MNHKHLYWLAAAGLVAGFYLANAASGAGIYSTAVGQTAANLYVSGNTAGGGVVAKT